MELLTSRSNPIIKNCRSLASSSQERREQGLCFLEGERLCCDAVGSGAVVELLLITESAMGRLGTRLQQLLDTAASSYLVSDNVAECVAQTKSAQGVFALCRIPQQAHIEYSPTGRYLLLDRLQDPGNLGTIIRCAEAFGIDSVICSGDCADIWSPKVLRSTMGSAFRQHTHVSDSLLDDIKSMQQSGVSVFAAALDDTAITPDKLGRNGGIAVVVGNEGSGVCTEVLDSCDGRVYIPMTGQLESLNAATAASILLWELGGRGR